MSETSSWEWIVRIGSLVALIGTLCGGAIYVLDKRATSIAHAREKLVGEWTNEGDITSNNYKYITLKLHDSYGDIIGTLELPTLDESLDVHVDVGWLSSTLSVVQLRGRSVDELANVSVKLTGNQNRIEWTVKGVPNLEGLPSRTTLWPLPEPLRQLPK